jgi:hypothetical protein
MTKHITIVLATEEGINAEAILHVPADIADSFNETPIFHHALDELFELAGYVVCNVEITEEIRHEVKREVWTEEQRKAYREKLKANNR